MKFIGFGARYATLQSRQHFRPRQLRDSISAISLLDSNKRLNFRDQFHAHNLGKRGFSSTSKSESWGTWISSVAPGVGVSALVAGSGFLVADQLSVALLSAQGISNGSSVVSGIPLAIILGVVLNNSVKLPEWIRPGLKMSSTTLLRAGIICVGAKLSFYEMAKLGAVGVPVVTLSIATGLLVVTQMAKLLGIPPRMAALIAAGSSICGVTAITALAPAIRATPRETAVAVANVVAFGTMGMMVYPYFAHAAFASSEQVGLFLGLAIHDTSQVMGAAMTYKEVYGDEVALQAAAVTKLTRNLFLAGVIPGLTWHMRRSIDAADNLGVDKQEATAPKIDNAPSSKSEQPFAAAISGLATFQQHVPLFVVGFVGASLARTAGDMTLLSSGAAFGVLEPEAYKMALGIVGGTASKCLLGTAMASVGLSTSTSALRGVGWQPFACGLTGALAVGTTAGTCAYLLV